MSRLPAVAGLFASLAVASAFAAPVPREVKQKDDAKLIVGRWAVQGCSNRGAAMARNANAGEFRFDADGTCTSTSYPATYALDPAAAPKGMTWTNNSTDKTPWRCLYELDGDTLKLAFVDANAEMPKKVEPGPTVTLYELKRVAEGK